MLKGRFYLMSIGILSALPVLGAAVNIDCDHLDQPLQQIIDSLPEDSNIRLYGTCYEPIKIKKDRLSILGNGETRFIFSPDVGSGIKVSGRQVNLDKIRILGGERGIVVYRAGSIEISDSHILNSSSIAIEVTESSYARITQTTISGSRRNGIVVRLSSSADIHESKIEENEGYGIVIDGSSADIAGNLISANKKYGMFLHGNAKARLGGDNSSGEGNTFSGNLGGGIYCDSNSVIEIKIEQQFDSDKNNYNLSNNCVLTNNILD